MPQQQSNPVDDLLGAMSEVGLSVWRMDQDGVKGAWSVCLEDNSTSDLKHFTGNGHSASSALLDALRKAGVNVELT